MLRLWSGIDFPQFDSAEYVSYEGSNPVDWPEDKATRFTINDILSEAGIDSIDEIRFTGAIVEILIKWECDCTLSTCDPQYEFKRLDSGNNENPFFYS